jgi:hypothetical protein
VQPQRRLPEASLPCEIAYFFIDIFVNICYVQPTKAENLMAVSISNSSISTKAAVGSTIGVLTFSDATGTAQKSEFGLTKNSAGFFTVSGNNLVTGRASIPVGIYSVRVRAVATNAALKGNADFVIAVTS